MISVISNFAHAERHVSKQRENMLCSLHESMKKEARDLPSSSLFSPKYNTQAHAHKPELASCFHFLISLVFFLFVQDISGTKPSLILYPSAVLLLKFGNGEMEIQQWIRSCSFIPYSIGREWYNSNNGFCWPTRVSNNL